jgi:cation-transporting P-type ATPase E
MPAGGLTEVEASRRLAERGEIEAPAGSRSYASIVRANVLTVFNLILAVFGAITLAFGDWRDALFLGILVANAAIGITQEVRAKRALDRLSALVAPRATVVRDSQPRSAAVEELVVDDLVLLQPGDQVVADGVLDRAEGLNLDESILTGESRPVQKHADDEVRSGSFAVEGTGAFVVTAVGRESYAERIAGQARAFRHPRSPLELATNRLLFALVALVVVLGGLLGYALWHRDAGVREAVSTSAAGVVSLVPEGLILLTSLTFAVGALRMARRGVLAQQLNAIESLASADVICLDKTGTLTEPTLAVRALVPADGVAEEELGSRLGRFAAASPSRNITLEAIASAYPAATATPDQTVAFSSRRRWSAVRLGEESLVMGAPELFQLGDLSGKASEEQDAGRRVVAFGSAGGRLADQNGEPELPDGLRPLGLVVLAEQLRPDTRSTVEYFLSENVELKVLSGDSPQTVAAIAEDAGLPMTGPPLDGRELPEDPAELRRVALEANVIGRISPEGKQRVVEALREAGRYVAMVGDGVNDVPALKSSRLALAQGSGSQMARSVADLVLVNGDFAAVPAMVAEGRQMLRNLQRVAKLYVTKSSFAAFLILLIGTTSTAYPLLPRHLTLSASIAIGIPSFFLALAPSSGPWRTRAYGREVAHFAVPAGITVGMGVLASYLIALGVLDLSVTQSRTVATTVVVLTGLYLIIVLEAGSWRRGALVGAMCGGLVALYALALALPFTRDFFELAVPGPEVVAMSLAGTGIAVLALYLSGFTPGHSPLLDVGSPSLR